ncbi:MAG TPA: glycosyltransferase, partial [Sphingomonadales bacterium]|nr:glycosyltransferase [Sphingomonadales bacterium]
DVIGEGLHSLVAQAYPGTFKIIAVNDNSSDETAAAAKKVKGPITVLDAAPLAEGWAGKLAALHQGVALAEKKFPMAEYFWFTDADIVHASGVLRALAEAAMLGERRMISQMVRLHCHGTVGRLFIPAFIFFFAMLYPFPAVNDPAKRTAGAAGGSILIDRKTLAEIGGISALKRELIDDCALARRVKEAGHRIWLGLGHNSGSIRPYTFAELWSVVARSAFTQLRHSYALAAGAVLGLGIVFVAPPLLVLAGVWGANALALALGLLSWGAMVVLYAPTLAVYKLNPAYGLALPAVAAFYLAMTVDSALQHAKGRGGAWKGRIYDFSKKR